MYSAGFVDLYDTIYTRMKNYEEEAKKVRSWIEQLRPTARTLLDVACGTAEHAKYLKVFYKIDGLDLSNEFLKIAANKNPECGYFQGDMAQFQLGKKYDVVMSLFSSIGYVLTLDKLKQTLANFSAHTAPGGLVLVEPWLTPDSWKPGLPRMFTIDDPEFKVCRMNTTDTRNGNSYLEFNFLVGTPKEVRFFKEEHLLGLFTVSQTLAAFKEAGLKARFDEKGLFGRGLFIGEKA